MTTGATRSCGCLKRDDCARHKLEGRRFGNWLVKRLLPDRLPNGSRQWLCECRARVGSRYCGRERAISSAALLGGKTSQCKRHSPSRWRKRQFKVPAVVVRDGKTYLSLQKAAKLIGVKYRSAGAALRRRGVIEERFVFGVNNLLCPFFPLDEINRQRAGRASRGATAADGGFCSSREACRLTGMPPSNLKRFCGTYGVTVRQLGPRRLEVNVLELTAAMGRRDAAKQPAATTHATTHQNNFPRETRGSGHDSY